MHLPRRPTSALHLGRFFCTPFPCGPWATSAPRECAGLRPSPPLRGYRCAPRRGARSAQRARNERGTSEERAGNGFAGRSVGPRVVVVGRQAVGRQAVGADARGPRVAVGRRSVGSVRSALRGPSAAPAGVGPFAVRPLRRGGSGLGAVRPLRRGGGGGGAVPKPPEAAAGECEAAKHEHGAPAAGARRGRAETSRGRWRAVRAAPKGPRHRHRRRRAPERAARTAAGRRAQ